MPSYPYAKPSYPDTKNAAFKAIPADLLKSGISFFSQFLCQNVPIILQKFPSPVSVMLQSPGYHPYDA